LLAKQKYGDKLKILFGIEISERFINPALADTLLKIDDIDVIICSLHDDLPIENLGFNSGLKLNDFKKFTLSQIKGVLDIYYDILNKTAKDSDYDILAHITTFVKIVHRSFCFIGTFFIFRRYIRRFADKRRIFSFNINAF
jgi:histidinol phosphatase-like PHP family hydrolase